MTCLAKDPAERWQSVRELKHALALGGAAGSAVRPRLRPLAGGGRGRACSSSSREPGWRFAATRRPREAAARPPLRDLASEHPDGDLARHALAGRTADRALARLFGQAGPRPVRQAARRSRADGGAGRRKRRRVPSGPPTAGRSPFWGTGGLRVLDLDGGPARILCRECRKGGGLDYGATWGTTGVIVYSDFGKLFRVPAEGGEPEPLGDLVPGETGRFWPQFLPDGRHYLYLSLAVPTRRPGHLRRGARLGPAPAHRGHRVRRGLLPSGLPALHQGRGPGRAAVRRRAPRRSRESRCRSSTRKWRACRGRCSRAARSSPFPRTASWPGAPGP